MQANSTFLEPLTNLVGLRLPSISPLPCGFSTASAMTCLTYLNMGGMIFRLCFLLVCLLYIG